VGPIFYNNNMPDKISPEARSLLMSKIRSKNTKAEKLAFSYLRKNGVYHQKHYKRVWGTPDIALPRKKKAVFIDSDFWHGRTLEKLIARRGSSNDYWVKKITRNMERDAEQRKNLRQSGWDILVIWEENIIKKKLREETLKKIKLFLNR
jgi:DNA mismatch endonuclease (patch repair protein)